MSVIKTSNYKSVVLKKMAALPVWNIILIAYLFNTGISLLFGYVLFPQAPTQVENEKIGYLFMTAVVVAPLVETYLTQHLIIHYTKKWLGSYVFGVLLCSIVFSLLHYYNLPYIAKTFINGFVYSAAYAIFHWRKCSPTWHVSIIHCLHNLTALIVNEISN